MKRLISLVVSGLLISCGIAEEEEVPVDPAPPVVETKMNNARLGAMIRKLDPDVEGRPGLWQFTIAGETVLCITAEGADRMRLLCEAGKVANLTPEQLVASMQANYHSALDGRYCIGEGAVMAAFLHPLGDLSEELFLSALAQVVSLKKTFGTTYSGGTFQFGAPDSGEEAPESGADEGDII